MLRRYAIILLCEPANRDATTPKTMRHKNEARFARINNYFSGPGGPSVKVQ